MSHHHQHSPDVSQLSGRKIFWVTLLNAVITIAEFIGGLISGSLALLSDSLHNLSDTVAIALSYFAHKIAQKPQNYRKTFGYKRAEIIAAFINSSLLLVISSFLIIEAIKRFYNPEPIDGNLMIAVALIGLLANLFSVYLLQKDAHSNINIKSSYLHLIGDTVSSVGVVGGGLAIKFWQITWIDPLVTLLIAFYIIKEGWKILKQTIDVLMQSAPHLDYEKIKSSVENISGVKNIHHVHAWTIDENLIHFEAHIDLNDMLLSEAEKIYEQITHILQTEHKIDHVTLQAEVDSCQDKQMINPGKTIS
ncbi:MAG: cation diffusion facilitator family transporter [Candidatus Cloacimonadales bacterium]